MFAYDLKRWQLTGGPAWTPFDQFAVLARAGRDVPVSDLRLMMRSLLEQRFGLLVHEIQPEVPLYALVLSRVDGRLGRGLKRDDGCTIKDEVLPGVPPTATSVFGCGSMTALVDAVSTQVDSPVIDRTGLSGVYHWAVFFNGPNMPSYRDALVQQLGLRLDSTRAPLKGLMIDSVRRPSED